MLGKFIADRLARTEIRLIGRQWPAFQVCGVAGVALAIALVTALAVETGLSLTVVAAIVFSAIATFLALVLATKIVTGIERIVYYHHEIAVILVAGIVARSFRGPALPYLDVTILGIGAFLACGRIGCLMVGCCHGRPSAWGIRYSDQNAQEGFPSYLVGVRLFPIQALESLYVLLIVIAGAAYVLQGCPPGAALAWYTIAYGAARFCFEFARGGSDRPYTWGFSQAQWLSLLLMLIVVAAELRGGIPLSSWHVVVAGSATLIALAVALHRKLDRAKRFELLHPRHVSEIAEALHTSARTAGVAVTSTSMGLRISTGRIAHGEAPMRQYAFSRRGAVMDRATADALARLVMRLRPAVGSPKLLAGKQGVFHLLAPEKPGELAAK